MLYAIVTHNTNLNITKLFLPLTQPDIYTRTIHTLFTVGMVCLSLVLNYQFERSNSDVNQVQIIPCHYLK